VNKLIIFRKLRWKNLLSTGNIFTEIELDKENTTLIVGENGAGKSTILDALSFVLFGKAFRKINKPQLLNSITQKGLLVEIEFTIGVNNYLIKRGIKPTVFEVYQNDNLLNQTAESKDYQEILEKHILKVNHKSFCQVVVLGSASFIPFMQLTPAQRREVIEDILELEIFTTMNTVLKSKISEHSNEISKSNSDRRVIEEKIKLTKEHLLQIQNNNEEIINEKKILIEETEEKISKLQDVYLELENNTKKLNNSIQDEITISKKINKLSQLRHQIEAKRAVLDKDIEFLNKHEGCPTCKQIIDSEFKSKTILEKSKEVNTIEQGLIELVEQYDLTNNRLNEIIEIHADLNTNKFNIHKNRTEFYSFVEYKNKLVSDIEKISNQISDTSDNKIVDLENELAEIIENYNSLIDQKNVFNYASLLLKDAGIKARIIKQYVPIINKLIGKYLSSMDFFVQFELDEEFNETIKSRFRDEFSYASFSEGEKMRINLAILFTWRAVAKLRNSVATNILIMDEVFDSSLDTNGTEEFLKIIKDLTSDTNTFIISHKTDQLYDKFSKVLKFEKYKNFSRMV
jgi:DNA repair exonuclease SbcCD ATPase subunit